MELFNTPSKQLPRIERVIYVLIGKVTELNRGEKREKINLSVKLIIFAE